VYQGAGKDAGATNRAECDAGTFLFGETDWLGVRPKR